MIHIVEFVWRLLSVHLPRSCFTATGVRAIYIVVGKVVGRFVVHRPKCFGVVGVLGVCVMVVRLVVHPQKIFTVAGIMVTCVVVGAILVLICPADEFSMSPNTTISAPGSSLLHDCRG